MKIVAEGVTGRRQEGVAGVERVAIVSALAGFPEANLSAEPSTRGYTIQNSVGCNSRAYVTLSLAGTYVAPYFADRKSLQNMVHWWRSVMSAMSHIKEAEGMITVEAEIVKAREILDRLFDRVRNAATDTRALHQAEKEFVEVSREALCRLLAAYVAQKGDGDCGESLTTRDGTVLPRLGKRTREYRSVFGKVRIERVCYGRGKIEAAPLDAQMSLPEHSYSYLLEQWTQGFAVEMPFETAAERILEIVGVSQPVRSVEQVNRRVAEGVGAYRDQAPAPKAEAEGEIVVVTADATSLPLCQERGTRSESPRAPGAPRPVGRPPGVSAQAVCSAVYTVAPFRRRPEEVLGEMRGASVSEARPRPQGKRVRGDLTGGKEATFEWLARESGRRRAGEGQRKRLAALFDGDAALWDWARKLLGLDTDEDVIGILDLFHVSERLWQVAYLFHAEGSEEARVWVEARLWMLLEGRVGGMIGGLRQMATKRGWELKKPKSGPRAKDAPAPKREPKPVKVLRLAIEYFQRNRRYMRYDEYLRAGYPIGSGVAEGTCRHLVKDRMARTGMRWTRVGAQAMLDLRAVHVSGQWTEFWEHHVAQETERLYGHLPIAVTRKRQAA